MPYAPYKHCCPTGQTDTNQFQGIVSTHGVFKLRVPNGDTRIKPSLVQIQGDLISLSLRIICDVRILDETFCTFSHEQVDCCCMITWMKIDIINYIKIDMITLEPRIVRCNYWKYLCRLIYSTRVTLKIFVCNTKHMLFHNR